MSKYKALIGLEMHCEISGTNTKVFSSAKNDFSSIPNSSIRPIDMAFPGTLPVVNKEAVRMAIMMSMILNCKVPEYMYFERKNYYYPDLPKGFQITQETKPIPVGIYGEFEYACGDEIKKVRIDNIHLEEDSASSDHYSSYSTLNYNREGVPLLELVTKPDFHNADEAVSFLESMRSIYQYTGISEADSKKGQVRCDVNVSIMDDDLDENDEKNLGTKIEIKNVNSFSAVREAINYEIERQIALKESGEYEQMEQQTRRWDDENGVTVYMRSKANAIDYRYFVEPNIPKFKIPKKWIEEIKTSKPMLPLERINKYTNEYGLSQRDAKILVKDKNISDYYQKAILLGVDPKSAANWLTSTIMGYLNKNDISINDIYLTPEMLKEIIDMVNEGKISSKQSKDVFAGVIDYKISPSEVVKKLGITKISDENILRPIITKILNNNQNLVCDYHNGKRVFDFFVGQVMKETKGQADPSKTAEIIREELEVRK